MHKPASCFLPTDLEDIDIDGWDLRCLPGKCAALMAYEREQIGRFMLPDVVQGRLRPDFGRLVGIGPRDFGDGTVEAMDVARGDYVLVRPYDGAAMWGWHPSRELRLYGLARNDDGVMQGIPWDDSILMKIDEDEFLPVGGNMLIRRDRIEHPLLPEEVRPYKDSGIVLAGGIQVSEDFIGRRAYLTTNGPDDLVHLEFTDEKDLFIAHQSLVWSMQEAA